MGAADIICSTLGKAVSGVAGGYTTGPQEVISLLRNVSRPYLFSNAPPPSVVACCMKVIIIIIYYYWYFFLFPKSNWSQRTQHITLVHLILFIVYYWETVLKVASLLQARNNGEIEPGVLKHWTLSNTTEPWSLLC